MRGTGYVCQGCKRKGIKFQKKTFFVCWLFVETIGGWNYENLEKLMGGDFKIKKEYIEKVNDYLDKTLADEKEFFPDVKKILYRYVKNGKAPIEREMVRRVSRTLSESIKNAPPSLLSKYRDLKIELMDYVREKGVTTQSEVRKNKRNFRNIPPEILDSLVRELRNNNIIDIHETEKKRVFLNSKTKY